MRKKTVPIAVDFVILRIGAWSIRRRRIRRQSIVIARPKDLAARHFQFIANPIAIVVVVAISVTIVITAWINIDGILTQIRVTQRRACHVIARNGVIAVARANPTENDIEVVCGWCRAGPCILHGDGPFR